MNIDIFDAIITKQLETCQNLLIAKGKEYAPDVSVEPDMDTCGSTLVEEPSGQTAFIKNANADRLAHFKKAAALMGAKPKEALMGMLSKHIVSVADMCMDKDTAYPIGKWEEKITDSINYLLILKALVIEEAPYE